MNGTVLAIEERRGREGGSPFITGNKREIRERQLGLSNSSRFEGRVGWLSRTSFESEISEA